MASDMQIWGLRNKQFCPWRRIDGVDAMCQPGRSSGQEYNELSAGGVLLL